MYKQENRLSTCLFKYKNKSCVKLRSSTYYTSILSLFKTSKLQKWQNFWKEPAIQFFPELFLKRCYYKFLINALCIYYKQSLRCKDKYWSPDGKFQKSECRVEAEGYLREECRFFHGPWNQRVLTTQNKQVAPWWYLEAPVDSQGISLFAYQEDIRNKIGSFHMPLQLLGVQWCRPMQHSELKILIN